MSNIVTQLKQEFDRVIMQVRLSEMALSSALDRLGKMEPTIAPYVIDLLDDAHREVKNLAVLYLVNRPDKQATTALLNILHNDESDFTRDYAVQALARLNDINTIPALVQALDEPNGDLQESIIDALIDLGAPVIPHLLEALAEYQGYALAGVIAALGYAGSIEYRAYLLPFLKSDDPDIRIATLYALSRSVDAEACRIIGQYKADPNQRVSTTADRLYTSQCL